MKLLKNFITKVLLGLIYFVLIPQQTLRSEALISVMKDFSTIFVQQQQGVEKEKKNLLEEKGTQKEIQLSIMSPLNGIAAKENIEQIARCQLTGSIGKLIKNMFYVRPDNSFGPTVAVQNIARYFSAHDIGVIVATIFKGYQEKQKQPPQQQQPLQEKTAVKTYSAEEILDLKKNLAWEKGNLTSITKITTEKMKNTKNNDEKKKLIEEMKASHKYKEALEFVEKAQSALNEAMKSQKIIANPAQQFEKEFAETLAKSLFENEDSTFITDVQNAINNINNELKQKIEAINDLSLQAGINELITAEDKQQMNALSARKTSLEGQLNQLPPEMREGSEDAIKKWVLSECTSIASTVSNYIFKPKEDDQYCNKQTLIDAFLVLLVYKCEKRSDFIGYFKGLRDVLGKDIFKETIEQEEDYNNFFTQAGYSDADYKKVKDDLKKGEDIIRTQSTYEKLLLLYYGYFIFEAPLPPYHGMATNIPWGSVGETYSDCGENSARLFLELLIYNLTTRQFDISLLNTINENKENKLVHICEDVIKFFEKNKIITDSSKKHWDWASLCENIPGVKYNKKGVGKAPDRLCDIQGGFLNMVNALAYLFGINLKDIKQEEQAKHVFDAIKDAFNSVGVDLTHNVPDKVKEEPTKTISPFQVSFNITPFKQTILTPVIWNFEPGHFYLTEWKIEAPAYKNVYDFLQKQIQETSSSSIRSLCINLLLLFTRKDYAEGCGTFLRSLLEGKEIKQHVMDILCTSNAPIKGLLIKSFIKNVTEKKEIGAITINDQKNFVNKLLPTIADFNVLEPILKDICNNKKSDFYDGAKKVLDILRDEGQKAEAMVLLMKLVSQKDTKFLEKFKRHMIVLVDQRNKELLLRVIAFNADPVKIFEKEFKEFISPMFSKMRDSDKFIVILGIIKAEKANEFSACLGVDKFNILQAVVECQGEKVKIEKLINDNFSKLHDYDKTAVLKAFIEAEKATEFNEFINDNFSKLNESGKAGVLCALIEAGKATEFNEFINDNFSMLNENGKPGILKALMIAGKAKAKEFKELINDSLEKMQDSNKSQLLTDLIDAGKAKEFQELIDDSFKKMQDSGKYEVLTILIWHGKATEFKELIDKGLEKMDDQYKAGVLCVLIEAGKATEFKELIDKGLEKMDDQYKAGVLCALIEAGKATEKKELIKDNFSKTNDSGKRDILYALIKAGKATEFKELIDKGLEKMQDSNKSRVLVAFIEVGQATEKKELIKDNFSKMHTTNKSQVLAALIKAGKATEFKELINDGFETMSNFLKTQMLKLLKQSKDASEFKELIEKMQEELEEE